jgi:galactose mutarotase-like enzyme
MESELDNGALKVRVRSQGAEVCSVRDSNSIEYIWQADPAVWPRHAPVLFPIVGKLKNDSYTLDGKSYRMGQHGFARDKVFRLESADKTHCVYLLVSDNETREMYPFDFELRIRYDLEGMALKCSYDVLNPSKNDLLFSIGAHPGFNCPLMRDESFSDYRLEFTCDECMQSALENGLRNGHFKLTPVHDGTIGISVPLFDDDALVFEKGQVQEIRLFSRKSGKGVTMACEGWPYFGIWSKMGCDRFVCLEPWHGIADRSDASGDLRSKEGIIALPPGRRFSASFDMTFS